MNEQNNPAQPREKKKLKLGASSFNLDGNLAVNKELQSFLDQGKGDNIPKRNHIKVESSHKDTRIKEDQNHPEINKRSKKKSKIPKIYQEDQFPPLNSIDATEKDIKIEQMNEKDLKIQENVKKKKNSRKKITNEWKEIEFLKKQGISIKLSRKRNEIKDTKVERGDKKLNEDNTKPNKKTWPTPKINRIRDIIIALHKEKNEEDPRNDIKNMANLIRDLKNKRKKPSKLKKAKLLYLIQKQIETRDHQSKSEDQRQNQGKNKDKVISNDNETDDGYVTYEEECDGVIKIKSKEENKEDESPSLITCDDLVIESIDVTKLPQVQYNQIKIRSWVDHILCPQIDEQVMIILNRLASIQIRKKIQQPMKFKRRIMSGMREVIRSVETDVPARLSKCIILALNIQEIPIKDGPDEKISSILGKAKQKNIPIIHSCTRRILGYACTGNQSARMSVVSIIDYSGLEEDFKSLIQLVNEKKNEFLVQISNSAADNSL